MNTTSQVLPITFTVGSVFIESDLSLTSMCFDDNFRKRFYEPQKEKPITIPTGMFKLKEYVLPKTMWDNAIQKNTSSIPLNIDTCWVILYCLIINPTLGKELLGYQLIKNKPYLMHVEIDKTVYAFRFGFHNTKWTFFLYPLEYGDDDWPTGVVFLWR